MSAHAEKRDPIKLEPLRDPAESLKRQRFDLVYDKIGLWIALAIFSVLVAFLEWWRAAFSIPPMPVLYTAIAVAVSIFAGFRIAKAIPELRRLNLGIRGERSVGQFLQRDVTRLGYEVFHDICENGCNIDHVAIGPGGVFAIETKTHSMPAGKCEVRFDGKQVRVDGNIPDRDPIAQANACAASLRRILKDYSGMDVKPRPVVLFPGRFVVEGNTTNIWVLNEPRFAGYLRNEPQKLSQDQVNLLAASLARYVRERRIAT